MFFGVSSTFFSVKLEYGSTCPIDLKVRYNKTKKKRVHVNIKCIIMYEYVAGIAMINEFVNLFF